MKLTDKSVLQGLNEKNIVLVSGMIVTPIIVCATSIKAGLFLIYAFSTITFLSIMIASFLPRKIVFTLRIILYTLIASLVYVPVSMLAQHIFRAEVAQFGMYFPLLLVNAMLVSQTEVDYFKMTKGKMLLSVIFYILGFDIVVLIFSFIREMISFGTVNGNIVGVSLSTESLSKPFGGFILLGLFMAMFRFILNIIKSWKAKTE
ncbi:MAG TPA: electron transport complex subunit E [Clostridiales bacterium]|nr:electron transport complex subunit E [Clostridiales bacterium]